MKNAQLQSIDILHVVQEAHMVSLFICLLFIFIVVKVSLYVHNDGFYFTSAHFWLC